MAASQIIKRYNAYYRGWCLAFGEHSASYERDRDISWLFGEDRAGLILSPRLRKQAKRELLGQDAKIPEFAISDEMIRMNAFVHHLQDETDRDNMRQLKDFLLSSQELHMFLCSHLYYPSGTRIITFARKKPLTIMYKEMQPLNLLIE